MATVLLFLLYFGLLTAVVPSVMDMQHLALRPNTCCHRLWLEVKHDMSVVKRKKKNTIGNMLCRRCIPAFPD